MDHVVGRAAGNGRQSILAVALLWACCCPAALATDRPIAGDLLAIKRTRAGKERLLFISKDRSVPFPAIGGPDDPTAGSPGGALVEVFSRNHPGSGTLPLPADVGNPGWKVKAGKKPWYRFKNADAPEGPSAVKSLFLKEGKQLRVDATSTGLMGPGPQGAVGIRVTIGSVRSCALFEGGSVVADRVRRFLGRNATATALTDCSDASLGAVGTINGCEAANLAACAYQPPTIYAFDPPAIQQTIDYTDVTGALRSITVEVRRPMNAPLPAPLVVWSHGGAHGRSDPTGVGDGVAEHLIEGGYVGVFIAHAPRSGTDLDALCAALGIAQVDCRSGACTADADCVTGGEGGVCRDGLCARWKHLGWDRPHDVDAVLDWLEAQAAGPLAGMIDVTRIVYAGHSAGAGATMMVAGATRQFAGVDTLLLDGRPTAFVSQSPQGPGDEEFTESSFTGAGCNALAIDPSLCLTRPHLVLSGVGDDTGDSVAENRRRTFDLMPAGDKYLLWLLEEAARHTSFEFEVDACATYAASQMLDPAVYPARCETYLAWLRSALLAFLDAHVRDSATARAYLASENLSVLTESAASWERR